MPPAPMWALPPVRRERQEVDVRGVAEAIAVGLLTHTDGAWRLSGVYPDHGGLRIELVSDSATATARWTDGRVEGATLPDALRTALGAT